MSTGRNRMRELASGIHGMMMDAENKRLMEIGESITQLEAIEYDISLQFILLASAAYLRWAMPALFPDGGCDAPEDVITLMNRRFPGIFSSFGDVPVSPCSDEVWEILMGIMADSSEERDPRILGWLYQFFISGEHDRAVDALKRKKVTPDEIPAATQLFTPEWVTEYLVDNSLGIMWAASDPSGPPKESLPFLIRERIPAGNERSEGAGIPTVFDPCVGSGNFLVCAFDVLAGMFTQRGSTEKESASRILSGSLFGCDIDERMAALARFALMMKAVRYDPSIGDTAVCRNIVALTGPDRYAGAFAGDVEKEDSAAGDTLKKLVSAFSGVREYGSLAVLDGVDVSLLEKCERIVSEKLKAGVTGAGRMLDLIRQARMLSDRYDVVLTNPPYLSRYTGELKTFVTKHYPQYKKDLFGVFIYRSSRMIKENGFLGMMTPMVWMFIRSFEPLRRHILNDMSILTLTQMEYSAFDDATVPLCAFVLTGDASSGEGTYFRLADFPGGMDTQKEKLLEAVSDSGCPYRYTTDKGVFSLLPASPIAYWASPAMISAFGKGIPLGDIASSKQGLATTDNERYLRLWHEVDFSCIGFGMKDTEEAACSGYRWFPYNKGGDYRKWYGNNDYVVDYENDGESIKRSVMEKYPYLKRPDYVVKNTEYYFRPSASWSLISSSDTAFRYKDEGSIFDVAGMSLFSERDLLFLLALCNTKTAREILRIIAPTINFQCGDIARIPVIFPDEDTKGRICALAEENIEITREDWDSFEISWDFKRHPLV